VSALVAVWLLIAAAPAPGAPVLVIGLDGLERRVVEGMWAEGYLPHLKALADRGVTLDLITADRSQERPVWTTVATGRPSDEHGITKNTVPGTTTTARGAGSEERQVRALWNVAHRYGLTSHVADWPASYPAESIAGTILTDRATGTARAGVASPPKAAASLDRWNRRAEQAFWDLFPGFRDGSAPDRLSVWSSLQALQTGTAELIMLRLRTVDQTSHRLWKYFEPENYPSAREPGWEFEAQEFYESYVAVDAAVGRLVAALPPQGHVLALSAHGFKGVAESTTLKCTLVPVLEHLGHLAIYGGEPEWRKTRLYVLDSPHSNPRKQVRVNLKGRERKGRVSPADRDALLQELETSLAEVQYAGTQTPAFRVEEPRPGETGDVVVVFNEIGVGTILEHGDDRIDDAMLNFRRRSGGHGRDTPGLLIAAGPAIAHGPGGFRATVFDVAPLVLHLLGIPLSDELRGRLLDQALTPTWRQANPVETTGSYERR